MGDRMNIPRSGTNGQTADGVGTAGTREVQRGRAVAATRVRVRGRGVVGGGAVEER